MRKLLFILLVSLTTSVSINAQTAPTSNSSNAQTTDAAKPKKQIFRATKEQIMQAQKMLKVEETGKLDDATRDAIKKYQPENGLKATGTLNRATLEKMGVALTDRQKEIPVPETSFAAKETESSAAAKPKRVIFRASKEQIMEAQKMLKTNNFYAGEPTGKLDDETRAGLKKYQAANTLSPTGTLNQVTLEKMGIALTDKQKENSMENSQ